MNTTPESLIAEGQKALVNFLRIELDLGFTYLSTASIEADSDQQHASAAMEKARIVLDTVRHFSPRVLDAAVRAEIEARANSLATSINVMPSPG